MALLPITLIGDKILRRKAKKVSDVDVETVELIKNMFQTMRNANGIGLAANLRKKVLCLLFNGIDRTYFMDNFCLAYLVIFRGRRNLSAACGHYYDCEQYLFHAISVSPNYRLMINYQTIMI